MTAYCGVCMAHYTDPCNVIIHGLVVRAERAESEVERLRSVVRQFSDDDDFVYGKGHTERSVAGRAALSEGETGKGTP